MHRFKKQELLTRYTDACIHEVSGQKTEVSITELVRSLQKKAAFLTGHIRATEWVTDEEGNGWFNGYYDNPWQVRGGCLCAGRAHDADQSGVCRYGTDRDG